MESFCLENSFLRVCTQNMQLLQTQHDWCGVLEVQMAAQAFQRGAQWASGNSCIRKRNVQGEVDQAETLANPNGGSNSMPPQSVRQDSERDL
jgi:hypothetical protein